MLSGETTGSVLMFRQSWLGPAGQDKSLVGRGERAWFGLLLGLGPLRLNRN